MICETYEQSTPKERTDYIGKLVHAVQSSDQLFSLGEEIIRQAERRGLLENVIINPSENNLPHRD